MEDLVWGARRHVDVDGVSVHVEVAGPGRDAGDQPIVGLVHGFASGTFTWAGVAPAWVETHRVIAWDRPPFGRSARPAPRRGAADPYRLEADLGRSSAVLGGVVGATGVVLVGHSAGALHAVQLTLAGGAPVRGLVLVAPALDGEPPVLVRRLVGLPGARLAGSAALRLAILGAEPALKSIGRHRTELTDATAREAGRCLRRPGTSRALLHLTSTWQPPTALAELGRLEVPALVIGGRDDRISSPASTRAVAELLGADLHLLDDVGHAAHEQRPDVVGALVSAFLESVAAG